MYGIGAKEKSQEKHREKPLHNSGLTFPGAARSAGLGEPFSAQQSLLPIGESQREKLQNAEIPRIPEPSSHSFPPKGMRCLISYHQLLTFMHNWRALNHVYQQRQHPKLSRIFLYPKQVLKWQGFNFFIICIFFSYSTICF